ncbi:MAG: DJ-1/PfpI family protein [Lachnospiraceae bacterium]|nr:DJ-1/PfpI family protein [Lachnospiraceae bacterium]
MSKLALFLADGFEEIEGLTVVDICRRCGLDLVTVSVMGRLDIMGSHQIPVKADLLLEDLDADACDMLILPGGGVGTKNLEACEPLMTLLDRFYGAGRYLAAICAAPSIFAHRGYLKGRKATCHPSFVSHLEEGGAQHTGAPAQRDGFLLTGQAMGASLPFALEIASVFASPEKVEEVSRAICKP